jgi:RND family efflux transporter MFP subunit
MSTDVDLRQLAVRRDGGEAGPAAGRRRRHLASRYLLPGAILFGFLAVLAWAARDSLLPARPVTVVPVLAVRAELRQEGTPLFQAAGWVEPRPTPAVVTALAEGVVGELLVVEGQEVKAGEPVARLLDADARLGVKAAESDLRLRQAEAARARAALKAARANLERPAHLKAALAEAEALLARKETEVAALPFQLRAAQSRFETTRTTFENLSGAYSSGSIPARRYREAKQELEVATAAFEELKARAPRLRAEVKALAGRQQALRERLELMTEEVRAQAEAEAQVEAAEAKAQQARVALAAARLRLERMVVRSPRAGRVLALAARPGTRLMGQAATGLPEASTVGTLYDPASLQVRADVRLEDVPRVRPGQAVRIETPAAPGGPLDGEVLFPTSQADIQKNTLQVKVAVKGPPPTLRPDMLVQVTFLAPPPPRAASAAAEPLRLLVPRRLVESGEGGHHVWVADQAAGAARRKAVKLGAASGELVEAVEGLNAADRLIAGGREGLRDSLRITVTGEDTAGGAVRGEPAPGAGRPPGGHKGKR